MSNRYAFLTLILVVSLTLPGFSQVQQKPTAIAPAEKLPEGWEEIDQRLVFLMVRLANVEASLDAVEKAIGSHSRKKAAKTGEGKRAEAGNDRMDRKGGGPMKWSEFYGTTAESFFYHPTDRNSTYHTTTILRQQGPQADNKVGGGVPAGQGLPVHQRPPQFDYIYRANEKAKERAEEEAADLKGKIEELTERRQRLEIEQSGLWCEVAFRAISHYDLDKKPLYRFEPLTPGDSNSRQNGERMKTAACFMALALSIIDEAQEDQAATFSKIKPAISEARQTLNDGWLRLGVDATDRSTTEGKFAALAKHLDDVASNLSDSYVVANEGDQAKDQQRKDTFRAMLQESLVSYAQIVLALDEMAVLMKDDWQIKPDVDRPLQTANVSSARQPHPLPGGPSTEEPLPIANKGVDDPMEAGLRWLVTQQKSDGSWDLDSGNNPSKVSAPTVGTALAVLPLLRAGQTPTKGVHSKAVAKGLAFIQSRMKVNEHGCQSPDKGGTSMYGHAIITMALCDALAHTKDQKLRTVAQGAIDFIVYAQDPEKGGWRYEPRAPGDTSVVGWQLQALASASRAKLKFPTQTIVLADSFLDSVEQDGGYAYMPGKGASPTCSLVGLFCRTCTRGRKQETGFTKGLGIAATNGPTSRYETNIYYDYYGTLLMKASGGPKWKAWCEAMNSKLIQSQDSQGSDVGSWFFTGAWSKELGRLGVTSFSLLILNGTKGA
jgi:hypothetical protein